MTGPRSEAELLAAAQALAGHTLGELATRHGLPLPLAPARAKGYAGALIERALGAAAGSRPEPDFPALGIELKTIPLDARGRPRESTFVCTVELAEIARLEWERSRVRQKLARVLWVPIESSPGIAFAARRVGTPRLWSPSAAERGALRADWEDLTMLLAGGEHERVTGHVGRWLQLRPKAAHGGVRVTAADADGAPLSTGPRGFYLRARFTRGLFGRPER